MQPRLWKFRIQHILDAIVKIERYTSGMTLDAFRTNDLVADAVIRNLEIVGEATRHVPEDVQVRHALVPWSKMRGMRNIVAHDYDGVRLEIVWDTISNDLPLLVPHLESILDLESDAS